MLTPPVQQVDRALWPGRAGSGRRLHAGHRRIARIYQVTFPPKFEQDLAAWRGEVASAVDDHEERLAALEGRRPKLALSPGATALAAWLAQTSPTGLEDLVDYETIKAAFPEASARELQDAAAELQLMGLAEVSAALGHPVRTVTPTTALFALFDPVLLNTSPPDRRRRAGEGGAGARHRRRPDAGGAPRLAATAVQPSVRAPARSGRAGAGALGPATGLSETRLCAGRRGARAFPRLGGRNAASSLIPRRSSLMT